MEQRWTSESGTPISEQRETLDERPRSNTRDNSNPARIVHDQSRSGESPVGGHEINVYVSSVRLKTTSTNPPSKQAIPASRGEVAELRRGLDGLAHGLRDFQRSVMDLLRTQMTVQAPSGASHQARAGEGPSADPTSSTPSYAFVPKRKGAPVRRSDEELTLAVSTLAH